MLTAHDRDDAFASCTCDEEDEGGEDAERFASSDSVRVGEGEEEEDAGHVQQIGDDDECLDDVVAMIRTIDPRVSRSLEDQKIRGRHREDVQLKGDHSEDERHFAEVASFRFHFYCYCDDDEDL